MRYSGRKDNMKQYQEYNDYELIYMVNEKNEDAFSILYEKYQPLLKKYASSYYQAYKKYGVEYDDLCQEAYLAFDRTVRYYQEESETLFYTFLCITVRSKILNYVKGLQTKKRSVYVDSLSLDFTFGEKNHCLLESIENLQAKNPEIEYLMEDIYQQIHKFCINLDNENSQMFELYWNGFTNFEISSLLDIEFSKVILTLRRLRHSLREYLSD